MKFTLSWLKRHLNTDADASRIAERLTALGLEVERLEDRAVQLAPFTVGYVVEAKRHPNADRLTLLDLYDGYAHGLISRRQFLDRAAAITASGVSAVTLLASLSPNYALADQVSPDDPAIDVGYQEYASPKGAGTMRGYLAAPAAAAGAAVGGLRKMRPIEKVDERRADKRA